MAHDELWRLSAVEAVGALKRGDLSPSELVDAAAGRIEAVDADVNALPIRCFDRARDLARDLEKSPAETRATVLAGLPIAVKDYNDVGGVATTYGSPLFADHVPPASDATVSVLEENGANPIAKSSVPEWAGGHTFNPVHGMTRNPWNLGRSVGGSSGGSAAALASGQVWLATGNDLGGSLRTPAGLTGIVGLRPGPGVVPRGLRLQPFDTLWVEGPMGRSVADVALMLDAGAGLHPHDPLSFASQCPSFLAALDGAEPPRRVAFSPDLGIVPVAREVRDVAEAAAAKLSAANIEVTDEIPDFTDVLDAFQTLRAVLLGTMMGELLSEHRDRIADDIVGNVERGFAVTPEQLFNAERVRRLLYHRMEALFQDHDLLICPTASIAAFPSEQRYVTEIDGRPCETYIDWFAITFAITMTSCPTVSLPCGLTADGLPVGLQLVGRPRGERDLLRWAHAIEPLLSGAVVTPIDPRPAH